MTLMGVIVLVDQQQASAGDFCAARERDIPRMRTGPDLVVPRHPGHGPHLPPFLLRLDLVPYTLRVPAAPSVGAAPQRIDVPRREALAVLVWPTELIQDMRPHLLRLGRRLVGRARGRECV